ncbi:MAG: RsmD family RNA methyltransferase [Lawsonibacter sp.]
MLDLFGGTGQMGIECPVPGRGVHAPLWTCGRRLRRSSGRTWPGTALAGTGYRWFRGTIWPFSPAAGEKFDLIFLDPPYGSGMLEKALEAIAKIDIMTENGIIVCESAAESALPELAAPYAKGRDYRYGKIKITLYHRAV